MPRSTTRSASASPPDPTDRASAPGLTENSMTTLAQPLTQPLAGRTAVAELAAMRTPGQPLETPFYADREVFETDLEVIFARHWIFVGHDAEIPEPGDFRTIDVGTYSVILVRDDDEEVRAFHNVCRHRGARILDGAGSVGNIVCGYHQWTYGVDGTLLHAGQQPPTFDRSCFGLKSVHVRSVAGLLYVCLAADPPQDFDDYASADRALPASAPAATYQGRGPDRHRRGRQLEAGDGEQPRVLPLRERPPRARFLAVPHLRLRPRHGSAATSARLRPLHRGRRRPASGLSAAGPSDRSHRGALWQAHRLPDPA